MSFSRHLFRGQNYSRVSNAKSWLSTWNAIPSVIAIPFDRDNFGFQFLTAMAGRQIWNPGLVDCQSQLIFVMYQRPDATWLNFAYQLAAISHMPTIKQLWFWAQFIPFHYPWQISMSICLSIILFVEWMTFLSSGPELLWVQMLVCMSVCRKKINSKFLLNVCRKYSVSIIEGGWGGKGGGARGVRGGRGGKCH